MPTLAINRHHGRLSHVLWIEIAINDAWNVRWFYLLVVDGSPVNVCAPWMVLYLLCETLCDALSGVFVEHQLQQALQLRADQLFIVFKFRVEGVAEHLALISRVEGRETSDHLEQHSSQGVVVDAIAVALPVKHFWAHVLS